MDESGTRLEFPIAKYSPLGYKVSVIIFYYPVEFSLNEGFCHLLNGFHVVVISFLTYP